MAMQTFPLRDQGMDAALRRGGHFLQQRGPTLLSVLLVLLLAWLLAELTWSFIPQRNSATAPTAATPATLRQIDANQVANRHLFGLAGAPIGNGANAPDTDLALTLHGIVAGKRASDSRALIVVSGDEAPYAIGAQLPGGAVIRSIYPDRVLLERNGQLEALRLPTNDTSSAATGAQPAMTQPQAMAPPTESLSQLRQEITTNPQRLMDVVRAMPVTDHGKLTGYRIYPSGNPAQFNQLGLRPGDVVSAVNGIPLTDPTQSMRVLSSLKTSDQVSITLIRNGQTQTQILQLPPPSLGQPAPEPQSQGNEGGPP